ncbi:MAG: outer membrane protein assembly factor BamA [Hyphomicrobium sp. 32-62-53]|nr:MAG: outer membrane protein assembly factor BamA [Hyphomicrobium sp. 12-62-95]OYX99542.1 MAG: outer membrane protein assembly factor BamA [Hyphomicrobium sp. 32-62-53]
MRADPRHGFSRISALTGVRLFAAVLAFLAIEISAPHMGASTAALAQGVVRSIEVEGNRRVEADTVRSYLQFSVGDAYDPAKVDASLKALFSTGLFADVAIDNAGNGVIVRVLENPVVNQVAFEGNSEVDTDTLRNEVQLKPRSVFTRARAQSDVQRILDVYTRQGRFAASVEPKIIELEQSRVNVVFEIVEGGATKVKGVNFVGNSAFTDQQLRDIISTTQQGWFDFLKGTSIYDPDRMNLDRELLRQFYMKNGYADARVTAAQADLDRDGSGFVITFAVEEGLPYNFGAVTVENGLPELNASALNGEVITYQGDTYNAQNIDKTVERLTLATAEQGFPFARVRPRATPDAATQTIGVVYAIDEGPRVYIERINVIGNTRTKDFVIRREFRLAEGDAYNPLLVDRAKKRLSGLGIFKTADVKRRPGSSPDRVVLDVEVEEQSTGELSFGAGFSTNEGIIGDVSITERNFMGNGQFLRLKLAGSIERLQVDLSFTEPRFLDRNLSAGFDLFHKELDQQEDSGFSSRTSGATLRLGFPLAEEMWMQVGYTLKRDEIFDVDRNSSLAVKQACGDTVLTNGADPVCADEAYWTSSVGASLTYDKRNHPRNPTSGYWMQLSTDFAGLGGDVNYVRVQGEGRAYYPVTDKITLIGRAVAGSVQGWGGDDVRLLDLYFRGGETVRGFDRAGYGPRDLNGDAIGGQNYWAATAEVRFPLPFIPDDLGISGAVFADAGSLWGTPDNLDGIPGLVIRDESSIRAAVGVSLLWNSPVGPLRVDYAEALEKESFDETQQLRFGASTKF